MAKIYEVLFLKPPVKIDKAFNLSLYITANTTTIQYNANATCFGLQQSPSG